MTSQENKNRVMKLIEAANKTDLADLERLADQFYSPQWIFHAPGTPNSVLNLEGLKEWMRQYFRDWPDVHLTVENFIAEDDKVVCHGWITGRNPINDQRLSQEFMHIYRFIEGKLVEEWELVVPVTVFVSEGV
jgi:predicted SnoaL-like aldol condensation-catalyzing enzyme